MAWEKMLNNPSTATIWCSYVYPSSSRHDLPALAQICTVKPRTPFPIPWKFQCLTDDHANHPGLKAGPFSTAHGRTQYSCSRVHYFPTEVRASCRLEEKDIVSFFTLSPSVNQWDAIPNPFKIPGFVGFFFHWNILSPSLRSRKAPWDFATQVFVSAFSSAWCPDKVLFMHPAEKCNSCLHCHEILRRSR